jgi:hypothetical protein
MTIKTIYCFLFVFLICVNCCRNNSKTDRYAFITKYNIENSSIESLNSLTIGNDEFTFSVDITGLQTFPESFSGGKSLQTIAEWDWPDGNDPKNQSRFNLGIIGLNILKENGKEISINDIKDPVQKLNLSTGEIDSRFNIEGVPVHVMTVCHPDYDMISVKIISNLLGMKRLRIRINFSTLASSSSVNNVNSFESYTTKILSDTNNLVIFNRSQNKDNYNVIIWCNDADMEKVSTEQYYLDPSKADSVYSFSCQFLKNLETGRIQTFGETEAASKKKWGKFRIIVNGK